MDADQILEQTQWDTFWVPPTATVVDRPELLYVSHPEDTPTLNVVNRIRAADAALPGLLAEASAAHAGRRSRVPVVPQIRRPALLAALRDAGYAPGDEHDAYVIATDAARKPLAHGLRVRRVDDLPTLDDAIAVANQAFERDERPSAAERRVYLDGCADPAGRVHRFVVYDRDGVPLTTGGITTFAALDFAFLWGGGTVPAGRGRGAYSALVTTRLQQARALGIAAAGLYARLNTSAPIVAAQGFTRYGRNTFWVRPAG